MEDNIMAIISGILIGAAIAVGLIYLYIRGLVRGVMEELNEHIERAEASMMPVIVEREHGVIFCYGEEDRQFICQGRDLEEIRTAMKQRFPQKIAYLAGGDEELVKELREEMIKEKIEGVLIKANSENSSSV